jgi:hypothetical protein
VRGVDAAFLEAFEDRLVPERPESFAGRASVVGQGEISTVFAIEGREDVVLKRMAGFEGRAEVDDYCAAVAAYCAALAERGIAALETECVPARSARGASVVYLVQPRLPARAIGNAVLREAGEAEVAALLAAVFDALDGLWERNARARAGGAEEPLVGIDAQISNWAWLPGEDGAAARLRYIDVSTPFLRRRGREAMNAELGLRSMPAPLAWAVRRFALAGVIERYYDPREVAKDIAANFVKEGRRDRIALALAEANRRLARARPPAPPLGEAEVARYYALDARIWGGFLAARRIQRALATRVFGRPYEYLLPEVGPRNPVPAR